MDFSVGLRSSSDGGRWCFRATSTVTWSTGFSDGGDLESVVTGGTGDGGRGSEAEAVTVRDIGGSGERNVG